MRGIWTSNRNPLDLIERNLISRPIIELRSARTGVVGHRLSVFERAAVGEEIREPGRAERMTAHVGVDSGRIIIADTGAVVRFTRFETVHSRKALSDAGHRASALSDPRSHASKSSAARKQTRTRHALARDAHGERRGGISDQQFVEIERAKGNPHSPGTASAAR